MRFCFSMHWPSELYYISWKCRFDYKAKFCDQLKPFLWWRYQDNIFDLEKQGLSALEDFTNYINSLFPYIKFELVYSECYLNVLDVTLYLVDGFIRTDVYSKPTDSHLYLPQCSAHPGHVFKAIPFGVATRLRKNYSHEEFFVKRLEEYKNYLVNQGYSQILVSEQLAKSISHSEGRLT